MATFSSDMLMKWMTKPLLEVKPPVATKVKMAIRKIQTIPCNSAFLFQFILYYKLAGAYIKQVKGMFLPDLNIADLDERTIFIYQRPASLKKAFIGIFWLWSLNMRA